MNALSDFELAHLRDTQESVFDNIATVTRRTQTGFDENGRPVYEFLPLGDYPCHYWRTAENKVVGVVNAIVASDWLYFAWDVDINQYDHVDVKRDDGTIIVEELEIKEIVDYRTVQMAALQGVS